MDQETIKRFYLAFAPLLEYPTQDLAQQAQDCSQLLTRNNSPAVDVLEGFSRFVEQTPLSQIEELFTTTFDLQAICYPYVGYHLFGESHKRGMFMAKLNEKYQETGFTAGKELPDHVSVVLRFLAVTNESDFCQTLIVEGLVPTLVKMSQVLSEGQENPYASVIKALFLLLEGQMERERL